MANAAGSTTHVLIFCEQQDARVRFSALFSLTGMNTRLASSEAQLQQFLAQDQVDVILLVSTADSDSILSIVARLRDPGSQQRETPIVVVYPQGTAPEVALQSLHEGAYDYLIEPFNEIELLTKITLLARIKFASDEFKSLAVRDKLTGLYDRRYLQLRISEEASRARRYAVPLTVMIVDVDNLSDLNKEHGEDAGDRVLVAIAEQLGALKRQSDVLARLGGDEFALVLYNSQLSGAVVLADRIRKALTTLPLPGGQGRTLDVSIGLAAQEGAAEQDPMELLAQAEVACRNAKAGGDERKISYG